LVGPIPESLFWSGSTLEVMDFGAFFFVGCILDFQRDVYLLNIPLVNAGGNRISTIPRSISSLRNTRILNFGKWIKQCQIDSNSFPHLIYIVAKHSWQFHNWNHSIRDWKYEQFRTPLFVWVWFHTLNNFCIESDWLTAMFVVIFLWKWIFS